MTTSPGEAWLSFLRPTFPSNTNPFLRPSASPTSSAVPGSRPPCGPQERGLGERVEDRLRERIHPDGALQPAPGPNPTRPPPSALLRRKHRGCEPVNCPQSGHHSHSPQEAPATLLCDDQSGRRLLGLTGPKLSVAKKHYFLPPNNVIMI